MARIGIVGGGIAGLTCARALQLNKIPCKVLEYGPSYASEYAAAQSYAARGIGLWNEAQLILNQMSILPQHCDEFKLISPASYRDINGRWLSSASNSELNKHRVATIRHSRLLQLLLQSCTKDNRCNMDIQFNSELTNIDINNSDKIGIKYNE